MASQMPVTYQEAMMKILAQVSTAMAAPDANLDELSQFQSQVLAAIRKPVDTPAPGSPVGSAMDLSNGVQAPAQGTPPPGALSPMMQALLMGPQPPASAGPSGPPSAPGSFPVHGLMAGPAAPPNMDEVRRMLAVPGGR